MAARFIQTVRYLHNLIDRKNSALFYSEVFSYKGQHNGDLKIWSYFGSNGNICLKASMRCSYKVTNLYCNDIAQRKPIFEVELSGVFDERAATR